MIYDIESCYSDGLLDKALQRAAEFIREIGEKNVLHIVSHFDEVLEVWYVNVVYKRKTTP